MVEQPADVGGFGRMASTDPESYHQAEPEPGDLRSATVELARPARTEKAPPAPRHGH